jgi:hypothetical protein
MATSIPTRYFPYNVAQLFRATKWWLTQPPLPQPLFRGTERLGNILGQKMSANSEKSPEKAAEPIKS